MLKHYPIRVLRYFLFLAGLFVLLFGVMLIGGWTSWQSFVGASYAQRWVLLALLAGMPLVYPFFGYGARQVRGNLGERRTVIDRALESCGYRIVDEQVEGCIVARAEGSRRFTLLMVENRIRITADGNHYVRIEGPKKEVVRIEYRIRAFSNL